MKTMAALALASAFVAHASSWAQGSTDPRSIVSIIAEQKARDAETAAGVASNGQLLYDADTNKRSWGRYCRDSQALASRGEFREAIRQASKSLFLGQRDRDTTALAYAMRDLAFAYSLAGDLDKAQDWADKSLAAAKSISNPRIEVDNEIRAPDEKVLGDIASRRGRYDEAMRHYETALSASNMFSNQKGDIRISVAAVEANLGHWARARELLTKEADGSSAPLAALARRGLGDVALAEGKIDEAMAQYKKASEAARASNSDYALMWSAFGLAKAQRRAGDEKAAVQSLDESLAVAERLRGSFHAEEFRSGFFADVQDIFDFAVDESAKAHDPVRALEISEQSRARAALDLIRERAGSSSGIAQAAAVRKPAEVAGALPEKTVVVVYHLLPDRSVAWTVRRDGIAMKPIAAGLKTLETAVRRWRELITTVSSGAADEQATALYSTLIAPLELRDGETVVFVPHKSLHLAPLQALRDARGVFIESHPVSYALSLSAVGETLSRPLASSPGLLVMGNPDLADPQLDLPGAEEEATDVARILGGAPYLRKEASAERFRTQAAGSGIVHVAAHATVDEVDPLYSTLKLSGGDVEAREVYGMNLHKAGLVAISACSSGLGKISGGDEFWGFKRSFLVAGARSLLVSLWPVSDESTSRLMQSFYRNRQSTDSAHALQAAQLELLRDHKDGAPVLWAPFILVGDWR